MYFSFVIILLFSLLSASLSHAQSVQCVDLFISELQLSQNLTQIFSDFDALVLRGKKVSRGEEIKPHDKETFEKIEALTKAELQSLSTRQLLDLYKLYARWNLLPSTRFNNILFGELTARLPKWTPKDFLSFAISRKVTPIALPKTFTNALKSVLLDKFPSFNLNTQLEVLSAELFSQSTYSVQEINLLLKTATESLARSKETLSLKALKELYRGLLLLRATEPTVFFLSVLKIEEQLERHMQEQGLSFTMNGTSGAENNPATFSYRWEKFQARLDALFYGEDKIVEYSSSSELGFYDPVDLFYPEIHLVVEWDGRHHYFRRFTFARNGSITGFEGHVLRPMDIVRDQILRRQGYDVLRLSALHNDILDSLDILALIKEQNP